MSKDVNSILIVNKDVINMIKELLDKKYERDGYMYPLNRVDVILEALEALKEKYARD